jgi:hypothetical protein
MASDDGDRLPAGRQPYDSLIGLRVGAVAGGLLGAVAGLAMRTPWPLLPGAVIGGAVGFLTERRKVRDEMDKPGSKEPGSAPPQGD